MKNFTESNKNENKIPKPIWYNENYPKREFYKYLH